MQQLNGLLQLGGHGQLLAEAELKCLLHLTQNPYPLLSSNGRTIECCNSNFSIAVAKGGQLQGEIFAQINLPDFLVGDDVRGGALGDDPAAGEDVGAVADA